MPYKIYCSSNNSFIDYFAHNFPSLSNFSDIKNFLDIKNINHFKYIYFDIKNIHHILYESENVIEIKKINNISDCFYIDLLIKADYTMINYIYSLNVIEEVNDLIKDNNLEIKNIILAKISLDFIYNYKQSDKYNSKIDNNKLTIIEEKNNKIINKYYKNIKDYLLKNIDVIYMEVFYGLIQNNKFIDYDYIMNIIKQIDFESITLTNNMFNELNKILEKELMKTYIISTIEDLFDIKKINFYYILIKSILKDSIFIYHIPTLLETRKIIIYNIKYNLDNIWKLYIKEEKIKKERINYIIKTITDSEYYLYEIINYRQNLLEILNYFEKFWPETKKEEILYLKNYTTKLSNFNLKKGKINIINILKDCKRAKYINKRFHIINYMFDIDNLTTSEYQKNKYIYEWNILEIMIKRKKYKKFRKNTTEKLMTYFQDTNNKTILLNIFKEEHIKSFIDKNINLKNQNNEEILNVTYQVNDNGIIEVRALSSSNLISIKKTETSIIRESYYIQSEDISNQNNLNIYKENNNEKEDDGSVVNGSISIVKEVEKDLFEILLKSNKYKILEYIKTIGKYKRPQFVKQLSNDYFLVSSEDKKLYIFDFLYNYIMDINLNLEKFPYDITENIYAKKNNLELIISSLDNMLYIKLDMKYKNYIIYKYESESLPSLSTFQVGENKTVIVGLQGINFIENLFTSSTEFIYHKQNYTTPYVQGIIINSEIIALTSNNIIPKGEDKLVFYNWRKKRIFYEIKEFSFSISGNGLCLINSEKISPKYKILLCACRKYTNKKEKKNGILVVCIDLEKVMFYHKFVNTENFEVLCFCQISIINNENAINEDISYKKNIQNINTDYFFVGGFDKNRRAGLIKLYRLVHNKEFKNTKIEFIQNIKIDKKKGFSGFKEPISSITQSNIIGNIIISCLDGNVHLFKPPNIDYFLN